MLCNLLHSLIMNQYLLKLDVYTSYVFMHIRLKSRDVCCQGY